MTGERNHSWNAYMRKYRAEHPRTSEQKAHAAELARSYYHKVAKQKQIVRATFGKAVKKGHVVKPDACESCAASVKLESHHFSYTRTYDVLHVCRSCHEWIHHATVGEVI